MNHIKDILGMLLSYFTRWFEMRQASRVEELERENTELVVEDTERFLLEEENRKLRGQVDRLRAQVESLDAKNWRLRQELSEREGE